MEDNFEGTQHSYTQQSSQPLPRRRTSQLNFCLDSSTWAQLHNTCCSGPNVDLTWTNVDYRKNSIVRKYSYLLHKAAIQWQRFSSTPWGLTHAWTRAEVEHLNSKELLWVMAIVVWLIAGVEHIFLQNDSTDKLTNTEGESNNLYAMLYK
jgi:hypothetical protein